MKFVAIALLTMTTAQAFAVVMPTRCYRKAEAAVRASENGGRYVDEQVDADECGITANRAAVYCEVAAYKGGGDAVDSYRVILTKTCSRVLRTEMTGEE